MVSLVRHLFATAVLCLLAFATAYMPGAIAQGAVIEVTAGDLEDDSSTAANSMTARQKVKAKIDKAKPGDVVQFPDGTFDDVGEILVTKDGDDSATSGVVETITLRGNVENPSAVAFTGKIMFSIYASDVTIEGFTFMDTETPDTVTFTPAGKYAAPNDDAVTLEGPHEILEEDRMGVVSIRTRHHATALTAGAVPCPPDTGDDAAPVIKNVKVRNNAFSNTRLIAILVEGRTGDGQSHVTTGKFGNNCGSSDVVISGNTFTGIGFNGDYIDREENVLAVFNLETAVKAFRSRRMTITDNLVDGTTYAGFMLNEVFGKTVVQYNEVRNVPSYGIRVKGNAVSGESDYEVVVSNNRVVNSNNDPYVTRPYANYKNEAGDVKDADSSLNDQQVDEILKPEIWRVSPGANFGWDITGPPKPVSEFADTEYSSGTRVSRTGSTTEIPQWRGDLGAGEPCGTGDELVKTDGTPAPMGSNRNRYCYSYVRFIDPALEAAIVLGQVNSNMIKIENNELVDNFAGLLICEKSSCFFRSDFGPLGSAKDAKIPAVIRGNNIYVRDRVFNAYPAGSGIGEVVNALDGSENLLDLSGNYLGAYPQVFGNVRSLSATVLADEPFDLSSTAGPRASANDRMPPGLVDEGGAELSGMKITLTYGEDLDPESVPAKEAFTVRYENAQGLGKNVEVGEVAVEGMSVTLTLAEEIPGGNSVTVSYDPTAAGSGTGVGKLRDMAGNEVAAFTSRNVMSMTDPVDPVDPGTGTEMPPTTGTGMPAAAGGDGGCALASGGKGGVDLGVLLPLMALAALSFGLRRGSKESVAIR